MHVNLEQSATVFNKKLTIEKRIVPSFNVAWHFHSEFEIVYVAESNGIRFVGDNVSPFFPGDLVMVGSLLPHLWRNDPSYYNEENPEDSKAVKTIVIKFTKDFLGDNFFRIVEFQKINKLLESSKFGLFFGEKISRNLHDTIVGLSDLPITEQYIRFLDVLYQLSLVDEKDKKVLSSSDMRQSATENSERIDVVLRYISDNYASQISLNDISNYCMHDNEFFLSFL